MLDHLPQHAVWNGRYMGTRASRLGHVHGMPDARGDELTLDIEGVEYVDDVRHDRHPFVPRIVQPAHEGTDEGRSRGSGEQRLIGGEYQGDVGPYPLFGQSGNRLEAFHAHRYLNVDVGSDGREGPSFLQHLARGGRDRFGADGPGDDACYLFQAVAHATVLLRHQARVGRYAGEYAPTGHFPDLIDVRGIQEDLHKSLSFERR